MKDLQKEIVDRNIKKEIIKKQNQNFIEFLDKIRLRMYMIDGKGESDGDELNEIEIEINAKIKELENE